MAINNINVYYNKMLNYTSIIRGIGTDYGSQRLATASASFVRYFNNIVCVKMFAGHFKTITRPQQHTRYGLYLLLQ